MFCIKFRSKIKQLIRRIGEEVLAHAALALQITTGLKKILKSPVADIIEALIPGDVDSVIRTKIVDALNYAIPLLDGFQECNHLEGLEPKLECLQAYLKAKYPDSVDAILIKLAALITAFMDDRKLSQHEYDTATQVQFSLNK